MLGHRVLALRLFPNAQQKGSRLQLPGVPGRGRELMRNRSQAYTCRLAKLYGVCPKTLNPNPINLKLALKP